MADSVDRSEGDRSSTSSNLIRRVKEREAEAWRQLVQIYGPLVVRWCLRRNMQEADAADVAQEVFQIVARKIGDFRRDAAGDTFQGWLRVITDHAIVDWWRRERRQPQGTGDSAQQRLLAELAAESSIGSTSREDLRGDTQRVYLRALDLLRDDFEPHTWKAFWRTTVDGLNATQVGAELGMNATAVRKAKSRVLARLRQFLAGSEGE
ncbi:MAG: sigma-70 family RNA polymerase sigma factor [Pirellulales bacterium]